MKEDDGKGNIVCLSKKILLELPDKSAEIKQQSMGKRDAEKTIYLLEKILIELPGKPIEINKDLLALLDDSNAEVANERADYIAHLSYYLQDDRISSFLRQLIKERISAFEASRSLIKKMPDDPLGHIFSFFAPSNRLQLASVCKKWKTVAYDRNYWLNLLSQELHVSRQAIPCLVEPHRVFERIRRLQLSLRRIKSSGLHTPKINMLSLVDLLNILDGIQGIKKFIKLANVHRAQVCFINYSLRVLALVGEKVFVKYVMDTCKVTPRFDVAECAAVSGNLSLVKDLIENYNIEEEVDSMHTDPIETICYAAVSGNLSLVQYLTTKYNKRIALPQLLKYTTFSGNVYLIDTLLKEHRKYNTPVDMQELLDNAALSGSLSLVEYLLSGYCISIRRKTFLNAATSGELSLVEYLVKTYKQKPSIFNLSDITPDYSSLEVFFDAMYASIDSHKKSYFDNNLSPKSLLQKHDVIDGMQLNNVHLSVAPR